VPVDRATALVIQHGREKLEGQDRRIQQELARLKPAPVL